MASLANFASTILAPGFARLAAANTANDGSGALTTLFTTPAGGARISKIRATNSQAATAAASANLIKVFLTDTAGANPRLIGEIPFPAVTRAAGTAGANGELTNLVGGNDVGWNLAEGVLIQVCQHTYAGVQDQTDVYTIPAGYA